MSRADDPKEMPQWAQDTYAETLKSGWRRIRAFTTAQGERMPDAPPGYHYVTDKWGKIKLERL